MAAPRPLAAFGGPRRRNRTCAGSLAGWRSDATCPPQYQPVDVLGGGRAAHQQDQSEHLECAAGLARAAFDRWGIRESWAGRVGVGPRRDRVLAHPEFKLRCLDRRGVRSDPSSSRPSGTPGRAGRPSSGVAWRSRRRSSGITSAVQPTHLGGGHHEDDRADRLHDERGRHQLEVQRLWIPNSPRVSATPTPAACRP